MAEITFKANQIFRVKNCGRCGGSGKHSYNQIHGDMCYGCGGTGRQWLGADHSLACDYLAALRNFVRSTFGQVKAGDVIYHSDDIEHPFMGSSRPKAGARLLRVEAVDYIPGTAENRSGAVGSGSGENKVWKHYGWVVVTLEGGEVQKHGEKSYMHRVAELEGVLSLCKPETVERVRDFLSLVAAKSAYVRQLAASEIAPAPASPPETVSGLTVKMALKKLPFGEHRRAVEASMRLLKRTARIAAVWNDLPDFARALVAQAAPSNSSPLAAQFERKTGLKVHEIKEHAEFADAVTTCGKIYTFGHNGSRIKAKSIRRDFDAERAASLYLKDVSATQTGEAASGVFHVAEGAA